MTSIVAKHPISTGTGKNKVIVPKGTRGHCKAISNSKKIREAFPDLEHKADGWYYICCFPGFIDEILCDLSQLELII